MFKNIQHAPYMFFRWSTKFLHIHMENRYLRIPICCVAYIGFAGRYRLIVCTILLIAWKQTISQLRIIN